MENISDVISWNFGFEMKQDRLLFKDVQDLKATSVSIKVSTVIVQNKSKAYVRIMCKSLSQDFA